MKLSISRVESQPRRKIVTGLFLHLDPGSIGCGFYQESSGVSTSIDDLKFLRI